MRKWNILVSILVVLFLGWNVYLTYGEKSKVPSSVNVTQYEVLKEKDYKEKLKKDSFVVPKETVTIHLASDDAIDQWLIQEGDIVEAGEELVLLQTERMEGQVDAWTAERDALLNQRSTVLDTIEVLQAERERAESEAERADSNTNSIPVGEEKNVELNVNMAVGVQQSGSFAQAIAEAERDLASIDRQLNVLDFQIQQSYVRPAIISPIEGVVAHVRKDGERPSIDVYSSEAQVATYVSHDQWEKMDVGDEATVEEHPLDDPIEGDVAHVSMIPAEQTRWLEAYRAYDEEKRDNPLDLYEVRLDVTDPFVSAPFGTHVNARILVNEATDVVAVKKDWMEELSRDMRKVYRLTNDGKVEAIEATVPFEVKQRGVVTDGLYDKDVVLYAPQVKDVSSYDGYTLKMKAVWPNKKTWKTMDWKQYVRYVIIP